MEHSLQPEENSQTAETTSPSVQIAKAVEETALSPPSTNDRIPVEVVQTHLSKETRRHSRTSNRQIATVVTLGVLLGVATLLWVQDPIYLAAIIVSLLFIITAFLLMIDYSPKGLKHRRRRKVMTGHLAGSPEGRKDVRSVGPFIDAWGGVYATSDRKTKDLAAEALIELLPQLKASDAGLLDQTHRDRLCQLLSIRVENPLYKDVGDLFRPTRHTAVQLRVAILQAFEQVGDSKALPVVERLAKGAAGTAGEKRIRDAARACLPALRQRADQEQLRQTLLRAAEAAPGEGDTLVRPAGGPHTASEKLLRPSEDDKMTG